MMMPLDAIGYQGTPQNSRLIFLTTKFTKPTKSRMNHTDLQNPHEHRIYANSSPRFPWMIFVCFVYFVVPFSVLRSAYHTNRQNKRHEPWWRSLAPPTRHTDVPGGRSKTAALLRRDFPPSDG